MTSGPPTRRASRRSMGHRSYIGSRASNRSPVGETLRDARELRGVDLHRVERDTKIRTKYLSALENGEFSDIPGDVYTRGFLRNYASYLGLDPDDIEERWRKEVGEVAPIRPIVAGPRPMTMRRRIVFQQSHLAIAMVALIVVIVGSYFGYQLTRYLSYPTLSVDAPNSQTISLKSGTTSYVLTGAATPGTTILISWNGQDPSSVLVDDSGHWTFKAVLQPGSNQFDITAQNLDTGHPSQTVRRIINVLTPTPTPPVAQVAFSTPTDGSSVDAGGVTVTGVSTLVTRVTLTATAISPALSPGVTLPPASAAPSASAPVIPLGTPAPSSSGSASGSPSPTGGSNPSPVSAGPGADGTFTLTIRLTPGRWLLTLVGKSVKGDLTPAAQRSVNVRYKGVNVVISVTGGDAYLTWVLDGTLVSQSTYPDGWVSPVQVATTSVCINTSDPEHVFITFNGASLGPVTNWGQHVLITVAGAQKVGVCWRNG